MEMHLRALENVWAVSVTFQWVKMGVAAVKAVVIKYQLESNDSSKFQWIWLVIF